MKTDLELNENEAVFFDTETMEILEYKIYSEFNHDWFSIPVEKLRPGRITMIQTKIEEYVAANPPGDTTDFKIDQDLDDNLSEKRLFYEAMVLNKIFDLAMPKSED